MDIFPDYEKWIDGTCVERNTDHVPTIHKPKVKVVDGDPGIAATDAENRRSLVELMLEHGITIPQKQWDKWRPTEQKTGMIPGVGIGLRCIMTDGLQAYFVRGDKPPMLGHVDWFKWDEPNVSFVPYYDESGQKKFFKVVTDSGAPPSLHKRPKKEREEQSEPKVRVKKVRTPMTAVAALDLIKRMTLERKA